MTSSDKSTQTSCLCTFLISNHIIRHRNITSTSQQETNTRITLINIKTFRPKSITEDKVQWWKRIKSEVWIWTWPILVELWINGQEQLKEFWTNGKGKSIFENWELTFKK